MAATLPRMAGVSAPKYRAQIYCTISEIPPTHKDSKMCLRIFLGELSVSVRITNGIRSIKGDSCMTTFEAMSQMASGVALPEGATSLASVITGTPTAPNPVGTLLAISDINALNPGLNPKLIKMAAGKSLSEGLPQKPTTPRPEYNSQV